MVDPFEVASEWNGRLRRIEFTVPKPLLPSSTVTFLHYAGVPTRFEIAAQEQVRFEFLAVAENLAAIWAREMAQCSLPVGWGGLWHIGDITYTQAHAWLCIEELSGRVLAVDVEIDDSLYVVNGSVAGMVRCMRVIDDWARSAGGSLARATSLASALADDPALPKGEAAYYWLPMIEAAAESGCDHLEVTWE
jgi:SUKH-4 immunity protein